MCLQDSVANPKLTVGLLLGLEEHLILFDLRQNSFPHRPLTVVHVRLIEEIAIALLIPYHRGEMPTLWHAWRLRQSQPRGL